MNAPEDFDMDMFLNDLRDSKTTNTSLVHVLSLIHHLWKDHPLRFDMGSGLVALSEDMAFDIGDIQYIRKGAYGDYDLHFKTNGEVVSISPYAKEYTSLITLMHVFNRSPEH